MDTIIYNCPECEQKLAYLDAIIKKSTGRTEYELFICHNEDCEEYGSIWNDAGRNLELGDPVGLY